MDPENQDSPELQQAKVYRWIWLVVVYLFVGIVVLTVTAEGVRNSLPLFGAKLCRMPGLSVLSRFSATGKLDLAHLFAVIFAFVLCYAVERWLALWLDPNHDRRILFERDAYRLLVNIVGPLVLFIDAVFFYLGAAELAWGSVFSFKALIVTVAYMIVLIVVSLISVALEMNVFEKGGK